jgi:hypothetical protein
MKIASEGWIAALVAKGLSDLPCSGLHRKASQLSYEDSKLIATMVGPA